MLDDAEDVPVTELRTVVFTTPKPGKPFPGMQGQPALRAELPADLVAALLPRLRRYPPRGGNRVRIYVDDVEQQIGSLDGGLLPEEDEPPAGLEVAAAIGGDVLDRRAEVARLEQRIKDEETRLKDTRTRVDAQIKQAEDRLSATLDRCNEQTLKALEHHQILREHFWALDVKGQGIYIDQATALDGSMRKVLDIRNVRDELLGQSGAAKWLELGRGVFKDFEESAMGKAAGLQFSAMLSALASKMAGLKREDGDEITWKDSLAAMAWEGRALQERKAQVLRFTNNRPRCHLSQAVATALKIIEGEAKIDTLMELVKAHDVGDAT